MGRVKCIKATTAEYLALEHPDPDTLYFVNTNGSFSPESLETGGTCYLGDKIISPRAGLSLHNGLKVFWNGTEVTNNPGLGDLVIRAKKNWYGTMAEYRLLGNNYETDVAYHILPQADWNEDDPTSSAYINNKPDIMDLEFSGDSARFYYK